MKTSIITITYNAAQFLDATMLSVLNQTCTDYEYLIIDGKSTDETVAIIKKYEKKIAAGEFVGVKSEQFHWISEPDKGLYDAMNKGLAMATCDFVWFVNAGDKIYENNTLELILNTYKQNSESDVIYGQSIIIDEQDNVIGERHKIAPKRLTVNSLLKGLVVCHQSILVRKSIAVEYDTSYKITADYDWVCKVVKKSQGNLYIDNYISRFMISGVSSTHRKKGLAERYAIMKKHFGLFRTVVAHMAILLKYPFTRKYS